MKQFSIRLPDDIEKALSEWGAQQSRSRGDLIRSLLEQAVKNAIASGEYKPTIEKPDDLDESVKRVLDYLFGNKEACKKPDNLDIFNFAEAYGYEVGDVATLIEAQKESCCESTTS